jgi:hypothetical protein
MLGRSFSSLQKHMMVAAIMPVARKKLLQPTKTNDDKES